MRRKCGRKGEVKRGEREGELEVEGESEGGKTYKEVGSGERKEVVEGKSRGGESG